MVKRLKIAYSIYNFFQKSRLEHNIPLFKKLGLKKKYYSSISSADFDGLDESILRKDFNNVPFTDLKISSKLKSQDIESLNDFDSTGYAILEGFLSDSEIDEINSEISSMISDGRLKLENVNKYMFAINKSKKIRGQWDSEEFLELVSQLMKGNSTLFQSINFQHGSEQDSHSDSIHMTTFPLGGLLGVWIALEDIEDDNGPLHYYPGSHKLPYYLNKDYGNEGSRFLLGGKGYGAYEKMIQEKLEGTDFQKKIFKAKKGDVLFWHANLIHGGEPHSNKSKTRKSMVLHYYDENCICYHEVTQRPALR